jgi:hypothetical protein
MAIGRYPIVSVVSPVAPLPPPGTAGIAADPCCAPAPALLLLPLLLLLLLLADPVLSRSHCNFLSVRAVKQIAKEPNNNKHHHQIRAHTLNASIGSLCQFIHF